MRLQLIKYIWFVFNGRLIDTGDKRLFRLLIALLIILFIVTPFKVSAYNLTSSKSVYNSGELVVLNYSAPFSTGGGSIHIYVHDFSGWEYIDYHYGANPYISGNNSIIFPTRNLNYNTCYGYTKTLSQNCTIEVEFWAYIDDENGSLIGNTTFNFSYSDNPNPISTSFINNTTWNYTDTSNFSNYSASVVASFNSSIFYIFDVIDYPISGMGLGIQSINSSLNNTTYNLSMSFLVVTVPPIINAIPTKIKALITLYLILLIILIVVGRD